MTKFIPITTLDGTVYLNIAHVISYNADAHVLTMSNGQTYHVTKRALPRVLIDLGVIVPQIVMLQPADKKEKEEQCQK